MVVAPGIAVDQGLFQTVLYDDPILNENREIHSDEQYYHTSFGRTKTRITFPEYEDLEPNPCCKITGEYLMISRMYIRVNNPDFSLTRDVEVHAPSYVAPPASRAGSIPRTEEDMARTRAHELQHQKIWKRFHDDWNPKFKELIGKTGKNSYECAKLKEALELLMQQHLSAYEAVHALNSQHGGIFGIFRRSILHRDGTEGPGERY
jgi:hypothetical protein